MMATVAAGGTTIGLTAESGARIVATWATVQWATAQTAVTATPGAIVPVRCMPCEAAWEMTWVACGTAWVACAIAAAAPS